MSTLIEFFDKDTIKNIVAPLSLRPDKVVFIYDKGYKSSEGFMSLEKCFKKHMPDIIMETRQVCSSNLDDIKEATTDIIRSNEECIVEFTGGSELMMIGGYMAGSVTNARLVYTDIIERRIIDLRTNRVLCKTARLSLYDFIDAKGARLIGTSHIEPEEDRYDDILEMCMEIFARQNKWRDTCGFFQMAVSAMPPEAMELKSRITLTQGNGRRVSPDRELLNCFLKRGFIKNLNCTKENIRLTFTSRSARQYIINYGVWLELYVYIHAKRTGVFDDVMLGAMIDWNAYDGVVMAGNEIDVIISDNSMPVFISCKMRDADASAINELVVERKRLGGWFSKNILVSFGKDKQLCTGPYKRARELGVELLDKKDIMSKNFGEILVNTIKGQDLVSLKWTKV